VTSDSARALLAGLVDYAGLFPPAALPMDEAVAEYARWRRSPEAFMLGRFVAPAARLVELGRAADVRLPEPGTGEPWRLSGLLGGDTHGDAALDHCRIGWGTITAVEPGAYTVSYQPIVVRDGHLAYGEIQPARVLRAIGDDGFMDGAAAGDGVAFHWRWACVRLLPQQVAALERYTTAMMALANQTF